MHNVERIKHKLAVLVAVLVVAIGSVRPAVGQAKESYLFLSGVQTLLLGDAQKASEYFKVIIAQNSIHAPSYYYLGRIAMMLDQREVAHKMVSRAIEIDSSNTTYLSSFVQILINGKEYPEAEALIAKLRAIEPNNQQNYQLGAALLLELGKPDQARELCEQYEQLFGLDERMIDLQRSAYLQTQDYFMAEAYMQRVVAAFPTDIDQIVALADLSAALMYDSTALSYYDRAVELDSTAIAPRLAKVNFFAVHKQYAKQIAELKQLFANPQMPEEQKIALFDKYFFTPEPYRENFELVRSLISTLLLFAPQNVDVRMLYGRYLTYSGQLEAAEQHYAAMIEQGVVHPELTERLLQIHFYQKQYAKALELSTAAYHVEPTAQMIEYRALAAWLGQDTKEALSIINQAIRTYRTDSIRSGFYALQGDIYEKIGQRAKSYTSYERSLRLNADNAGVLNNYAYHLSVDGKQLDRALVMAQRANELSPDNPTFLDTEAWVLFKLGRYVDAQMLMGRVFALDARPSAEVLMHYGDILYELGDDFLARNYWKKAAEAGASASDIESRVLRPKAKRPTDE